MYFTDQVRERERVSSLFKLRDYIHLTIKVERVREDRASSYWIKNLCISPLTIVLRKLRKKNTITKLSEV